MNSSGEEYSTSRRGAIAAAGSLATVGLAGCGGDPGTEGVEPGSDDTEPELKEVNYILETGEQPIEADLTDEEYLEFRPEVKKQDVYEDETRESTLQPEDYQLEITAKKTSEDGEYGQQLHIPGPNGKLRKFDQETLEDLNLLRDTDPEILEDGTVRIDRDNLIAGYTELNYQIQVQTDESNTLIEDNQIVDVKKPEKEEREDILLDNPEIVKEMQEIHAEYVIENIGTDRRNNGGYDGLKGLKEAIMEDVDPDAEGQELLYQISHQWGRKAPDHYQGPPSGHAHTLLDIIAIEADYRPFLLNNEGHKTILTMDIDKPKMYNVDTSGWGEAVNPPKNLQWIIMYDDRKEKSPLYNYKVRGGAGYRATTTISAIPSSLDSGEDDASSRVNVEDNYAMNVMPHFADDTDLTEDIFIENEKAALTALMHKEYEINISGEPGEADLQIRRSD